MTFPRPHRPSFLAPGWEDRWTLLLGGSVTRRGPLGPGLARAWLSARSVCWPSRSVTDTEELALSCPFVRG